MFIELSEVETACKISRQNPSQIPILWYMDFCYNQGNGKRNELRNIERKIERYIDTKIEVKDIKRERKRERETERERERDRAILSVLKIIQW